MAEGREVEHVASPLRLRYLRDEFPVERVACGHEMQRAQVVEHLQCGLCGTPRVGGRNAGEALRQSRGSGYVEVGVSNQVGAVVRRDDNDAVNVFA